MSKPLHIVLHGASGEQGRVLARTLVEAGHVVRAVSRRPVAASSNGRLQPVVADLDDRVSLAAAYQGADAVVVQLPLVFSPTAVTQADNVLSALAHAKVPRAVLNAGAPLPPGRIGIPYVDARVKLAQELSNVAARSSTVSPAGPYLENLAAPWSEPLVRQGFVRYPLPLETPIPWISLKDVAALVQRLLTAPEPQDRAVLAGPAAVTGHEVADAISAALGRSVQWESISHHAFADMLRPHLGDEAAEGVASSYASPLEGPPPPDPDTLQHGSTTVREWAVERWGSPSGRAASDRPSTAATM